MRVLSVTSGSARRLLLSTVMVDLLVVHSPVGGGHKAAAGAIAEAARERGLSVEVLDVFEHAPRLFGEAYLGAHLAGQSVLPRFYGSAYFAANHRGRVRARTAELRLRRVPPASPPRVRDAAQSRRRDASPATRRARASAQARLAGRPARRRRHRLHRPRLLGGKGRGCVCGRLRTSATRAHPARGRPSADFGHRSPRKGRIRPDRERARAVGRGAAARPRHQRWLRSGSHGTVVASFAGIRAIELVVVCGRARASSSASSVRRIAPA